MAKKDNSGSADETVLTLEQTVESAQEVAESGLVELKHFVQNGVMGICGETYNIINGIVKVKPEHVQEAREHISMGG